MNTQKTHISQDKRFDYMNVYRRDFDPDERVAFVKNGSDKSTGVSTLRILITALVKEGYSITTSQIHNRLFVSNDRNGIEESFVIEYYTIN